MNNESLDQLWDLIESGKKGNNIGIRTGLPKLDKIIGGIQPSRYIIISSGTSGGKTAIALYIMYNILKNEDPNKPVYFFYASMEIGSDVLWSKLMGLYCAEEFGVYLTTNDIMSFDHPISEENYKYLTQAKKWIESIAKYVIIKDETMTANKLYSLTLDVLEEVGLKKDKSYTGNTNVQLIGIIDHIALLRPGQAGLKAEIDTASAYMVSLKRKYKMSWFVMVQQNRNANDMARRQAGLSEPKLEDLKDSSSTAQDSDIVIQIFYPFREQIQTYRGYRIVGEDALRDTMRSLIIGKNRYGVANKRICCSFYGSVGWWKELPPAEQIQNYSDYTQERLNIPCKNTKINNVKDLNVKDNSSKDEFSSEIIYNF